jgi:transaldolase
MTTSLDHLKQTGTVVVSDSGDFACECALSETPSLSASRVVSQPSMSTNLRHDHLDFDISIFFSRSSDQDATTNPSLILAAANKPGYARLMDVAVNYAKDKGGSIDEQANAAMDRLVCPLFRCDG